MLHFHFQNVGLFRTNHNQFPVLQWKNNEVAILEIWFFFINSVPWFMDRYRYSSICLRISSAVLIYIIPILQSMHDTDRCRLGKQFQVNNYYKQYMYLYNFIIRLYVTRPLRTIFQYLRLFHAWNVGHSWYMRSIRISFIVFHAVFFR